MQGALSYLTPVTTASSNNGKVMAHQISPNYNMPPGAKNLSMAHNHTINYGQDRFDHLRNTAIQQR